VEATLNLGKVLASCQIGVPDGCIDVGLTCDDDPGATLALGTELLGDGLQAEHELGVGPNELAHLIHQKNDFVVSRTGGKVVFDHFGKAFDVDAVIVPRAVKPLASGSGCHLEGRRQRGDHVIAKEVNGVALFLPTAAVGG